MGFINKNSPTLIVAEISANHCHNFNRAVAMIKRAKECGVDAVKFQTYTPDTLTIDCNNRYFQIHHHKWGGQTLYQLYKKAYTPWHWLKAFKRVADDLGILFFSTAFDNTAVDFLEELNVPIHKIASFELVDLPLIEYAARTKKPLILSTGMATLSEIGEAVTTARNAGANDIVLLKCVSSYPAKPEEMNLRSIPILKKEFRLPVGLSDHTLGIGTSVASVVLGAQLIEKHFTLSRNLKNPDSFFSIEPRELKELVDNVRIVEKSLGKAEFTSSKDEKKNRIFRPSLFAIKDIKKGEDFTEENINSVRPSFGLHTRYLKDILNKKALRNIRKGTPLAWRLID